MFVWLSCYSFGFVPSYVPVIFQNLLRSILKFQLSIPFRPSSLPHYSKFVTSFFPNNQLLCSVPHPSQNISCILNLNPTLELFQQSSSSILPPFQPLAHITFQNLSRGAPPIHIFDFTSFTLMSTNHHREFINLLINFPAVLNYRRIIFITAGIIL